jgi:hypothetical protein
VETRCLLSQGSGDADGRGTNVGSLFRGSEMSDREKARPALIIFRSLEYITSFAVAWLARSSFFEASGRLPMFSNFVRAT